MAPPPMYHFIPEAETFERRLLVRLGSCRQSVLASAFFTMGAFQSIKQSLNEAMARGAQVTFLLGRLDFVTDPRAVDALQAISNKYKEQLHVYFDADFAFHYKLAIFACKHRNVVIIGSSNLTPKGLGTIGEANLEISGNPSVYSQASDLLRDRVARAIRAQDGIDDYRRRYRRAMKYRRARSRWYARSKRAWHQAHRAPTVYAELISDRFAFCWIGDREHDKSSHPEYQDAA